MTGVRFVLPLRDAPRFERYPWAVCSECNQPVVDGVCDDATLVCSDCLLKDAPPTSPQLEPHSFVHPEHCADCCAFNPHPRRTDPLPWSGGL